jgi:hypothetical protein
MALWVLCCVNKVSANPLIHRMFISLKIIYFSFDKCLLVKLNFEDLQVGEKLKFER